jgi:ADP-heptose:LPS heptosyltransferase
VSVSPASTSVLIVRLDAIGDALTLVPVIAALRGHGLSIGAVLRPENSQVFSARAIDRVHVAPNGASAALLAEVRDARYGVALVATELPDGYRIAYQAHIPKRIAFDNGWGKPLKTLWIRRLSTHTIFRTAGLDPRALHECDVLFKLAQAIVNEPEPARDARVLRPLVLDEEPQPDQRVAFQVTRKWERLGVTLEDVVQLARAAGRRHELRYLASAREAAYAQAFARASSVQIEFFETLAPWKSAIASAQALVAPDSGAAHVAGMTGTPVVVCFADEKFDLQTARWSPWAARHRIVRIERGFAPIAADALDDLISGSRAFSYKG